MISNQWLAGDAEALQRTWGGSANRQTAVPRSEELGVSWGGGGR